MSQRSIFSHFFTLAISVTLFWAIPAQSLEKNADTRPAMQGFSQEIYALRPYLLDQGKFQDPKNEADISKHLKNMTRLAKSADHKKTLNKADYKMTIDFMVKHLADTEKNFHEGNKSLSRYMLQSAVHTCISCHARLPIQNDNISINKDISIPKGKTFEEAEFLFATRQFSSALTVFQKIIIKYPKNKLAMNQLMDSLDYTATIYARIKRDPKNAVPFFSKIVKKKNLPAFLQEDTQAWLKSFKQWSEESIFELKGKTDLQIVQKAENILGTQLNNPFYVRDRSNHITYLRASGILHEFLIERPNSKQAPKAYYLLGVSYLTLEHDFFTGFDQLYLKTCIQKYPKDPVAKSCYNLLEESVYLSYSGSSGVHIPFEVIQELNNFKKTVY